MRWCQAAGAAALARGPGVSPWPLSSPAQVSSLSAAQNNLFRTSGNEWVLLNLNVTGYYRVNYDEENWRKIQTQLQTDHLVGVCHPLPCPLPQDRPETARPATHSQPMVTCSASHSRPSLSSIGHRSLMMPSTWPGECSRLPGSAAEARDCSTSESAMRPRSSCCPSRMPGAVQ